MFNFSGSEIIFLLILGLVVLGPEKLPPVLRKMGQLYGQFKKITGDAQSEFRGAFAEPMREMQKAANEYKNVFTDASKQAEAQFHAASTIFDDSALHEEPAVEPIFIPYEAPTAATANSAPDHFEDELSMEPTIVPYNTPETN